MGPQTRPSSGHHCIPLDFGPPLSTPLPGVRDGQLLLTSALPQDR